MDVKKLEELLQGNRIDLRMLNKQQKIFIDELQKSGKIDTRPLDLMEAEQNHAAEKVAKEKLTEKEGCLSCQKQLVEVRRPIYVGLKYFCRHGEEQYKTFYYLSSRVVQHEMDHLNGKLIIDKDFLEEAEKEKEELNESYKESVRQAKERKE